MSRELRPCRWCGEPMTYDCTPNCARRKGKDSEVMELRQRVAKLEHAVRSAAGKDAPDG